jgi:hypothetical protein
MPIAGGVTMRIPVFLMVMPAGSSPIEGSHARPEEGDE